MKQLGSLQNRHVLVTGAAGFIGSHLCDALLEAGAKVLAVDNLLTGNRRNIEHLVDKNSNFSFIEADVIQPAETYLPKDFTPDIVLHFASPASPPLYQAHPVETYAVNSFGTHHLLQYLLKKAPKARFLFASTSEVYGDPMEHPQKESYWGNVNPNGLRSCYDEGKRLGETICGVHFRDLKLNVRIVRIFNTYGPRMDIDDGRVIPNFIKESLSNKPLTIFGEGKQTRSYCYVSDLVDGILRFIVADDLVGETINLGNADEYTILETAKAVEKLTGNSQILFKPLPQDDPMRRQPDISKAQKLLGWSPKVGFQEGLEKTYAYFQQRHAQKDS